MFPDRVFTYGRSLGAAGGDAKTSGFRSFGYPRNPALGDMYAGHCLSGDVKCVHPVRTGIEGQTEVDTPKFIVESDATIVLPLIFDYVLGR